MKKYLLIIFILSTVAIWPYLSRGFPQTHDGEWMIIRFSAFHQTLRSGQFPVRFVDRLNNNYGYPVVNFLYPLPFYLAEIPKLTGFGFTGSIKTLFAVSSIVSAFSAFWFLSQKFSKIASLAGTVVYLYIPYRFADLFVRGSVGENLAFVFIPLCFGAILKIKKGEKKYLPVLSITAAALILSHNVIAILFLPLLVAFTFLTLKNDKMKAILMVALGIASSAFFWLPAIYDLPYVRLSQIKVSEITNHLVPITKIIVPSWGYGPNPNAADGISVQLGIVSLFLLASATTAVVFSKKRENIMLLFIALYFIIFFLMTKHSAFFWEKIPIVDVIQFPWRLLSVIVFISAFLAAMLTDYSEKKKSVAILLILGSIFSTFLYTFPSKLVYFPDDYYQTNEDTTTVRDEYLPLWVKQEANERAATKIEIPQTAKAESIRIRPAKYMAKITASEEITLTVNTIYFPGWRASVDNMNAAIDYQNPKGLITFKLPKGQHDVIIKYGKTPVHLLAELVSISSLIVTGFLFSRWRRKNFS